MPVPFVSSVILTINHRGQSVHESEKENTTALPNIGIEYGYQQVDY